MDPDTRPKRNRGERRPSFLFPFFFRLYRRETRTLISMHQGQRGWPGPCARCPSCNGFIMRHLRSFRAHDPDTYNVAGQRAEEASFFLISPWQDPLSLLHPVSFSLLYAAPLVDSKAPRERTRPRGPFRVLCTKLPPLLCWLFSFVSGSRGSSAYVIGRSPFESHRTTFPETSTYTYTNFVVVLAGGDRFKCTRVEFDFVSRLILYVGEDFVVAILVA